MTDPRTQAAKDFGVTYTPAEVGPGQSCWRCTLVDGLFARRFWPAALFAHVDHVIALSAKKQVIGIYAGWIVAFMQNIHVVWNRTYMQLPTNMRGDNFLFATRGVHNVPYYAAARFGMSAKPGPTFVWSTLVYLLPKAFGKGTRLAVPANEARRLSLDPAMLKRGLSGNPSGLSATASTKPRGIWQVRDRVLSCIMTANELTRFTLDVTVSCAVLRGYLSFLPATALAVAVGNVLRGIMGLHKKLAFLVPSLGTPASVAGALCVGFTRVIIPQVSA